MSFQGRVAEAKATADPAPSRLTRGTDTAPPQAELENLVAAIPDAVLVVDGQDIIRFVNPSARALLRSADDELVGQQLSFAVRRNQVAEIELLVRGEPRRAQLRTVDCTWNGAPALLAMMRDVSEQRRLEAILESERAFSERRLKDALDAGTAIEAGGVALRLTIPGWVSFGFPESGSDAENG